MSSPKISIVVPIYNVENYLPQCLDSIMFQSFQDWECILVDDGSKDGSAKICDEYVQKDNRFSVIHKPNGGVSSARNVGIEQAYGEWVFFSDADDTLEPDALESLYNGNNENLSLVMGGYTRVSETGAIFETQETDLTKKISEEEAIKELYNPSNYSYQGYLWCKLLRLDLIKKNHLSFNEQVYFNEDRLFLIQYLCRTSGEVLYFTKPVYNYVVRSNSAMGSLKNGYNKKYLSDFDAFVLMKSEVFTYTSNKELRTMALQGIVKSFNMNHSLMFRHKQYDSQAHKKMLKGLIFTGAIKRYLFIMLYPMIQLLFPRLLVNRD